MTTPCFPPGTQITFALEPEDPYTVRCANERYAILTRPFTARDIEAFGLHPVDCEDWMGRHMIYSIVDAEQKIRGKNHFVFNHYPLRRGNQSFNYHTVTSWLGASSSELVAIPMSSRELCAADKFPAWDPNIAMLRTFRNGMISDSIQILAIRGTNSFINDQRTDIRTHGKNTSNIRYFNIRQWC